MGLAGITISEVVLMSCMQVAQVHEWNEYNMNILTS